VAWQIVINVSEGYIASIFRIGFEGRMFLENGIHLPQYTLSEPRRPHFKPSQLRNRKYNKTHCHSTHLKRLKTPTKYSLRFATRSVFLSNIILVT
jgi:hypothetical protein